MSYEFGGVSYDTAREYYAAIAREWLSGDGQNSRQFVRETFAEETDEDLADEVLDARECFDDEPEFDSASLVEAFAAYRAAVNSAPVEDDEANNRRLW
jgi:hypothetical protein